jgi:tetratricopeptide (TPR) repeat protein
MLSSESRCERVAVFGLGGVGKTQIALEFAHQWREKHPDCAVFWIPVTNVESMLEAHLEIGRQLQIPNIEQERGDVQKLVQGRLGQECYGKWLLVFDNADDIDIWTDEADNTLGSSRRIDYLPKSKHGSILFTTRSRKAATKLAGKNVVLVGEMDYPMAKALLEKSLVHKDLLTDGRATTDLLKKLTNLPLAIVQAAAYINENEITLSEYAVLLDDTEQNIVDILSEEFEDEGRYGNVKNPIATTWLISFEQIRTRDPLAGEYLSFMSCVNARGIPQSLLPPAQSNKNAVDAIGTLSAYSFITKHKTDKLLDLHRLVHLATRNWLRTEGSLQHWTAKALKRLDKVFPDDDHRNRSVWRMYLPHARYALEAQLDADVGVEKAALLWKFGECVYSDGRYEEAEKVFTQVMETSSRVLGVEHPTTLGSMANLASTYKNQGRWKEAEELQAKELEICSRVFGAENPSTMFSMVNLASIYSSQGRWKEAEELEAQVMDTSLRVLGIEYPDTLTSMANLASTYSNQGRWKEAEELGVQVIETSLRVLEMEHPITLTSMANLASIYGNQGQWKKAEELGMQVMKTSLKVLGIEHPDTLISMANLVLTYNHQGQWKKAEELGVQVMEIGSRVLKAEHPILLTSMDNLASTYWNQEQWKKAKELGIQVMETRKRVFGMEHPITQTSIANMALIYRNQGEWKKAEELETQVIETKKSMLGEEHLDILTGTNNFTDTFKFQGCNDKGISLLKTYFMSRARDHSCSCAH